MTEMTKEEFEAADIEDIINNNPTEKTTKE